MEVEVELDYYYYLAVARPVFVCSAWSCPWYVVVLLP